MDGPVRAGVSFGLTSSVITTLGLMIGLAEGTGSRIAVVGGVLIIAVADSLSDALAMHLSKESETVNTPRQVWESTFATAGAKFVFAASFLIPVLTLPVQDAIICSIFWGFLLITLLSAKIASIRGERLAVVITEHLLLTVFIVFFSYYAGEWVGAVFSG